MIGFTGLSKKPLPECKPTAAKENRNQIKRLVADKSAASLLAVIKSRAKQRNSEAEETRDGSHVSFQANESEDTSPVSKVKK